MSEPTDIATGTQRFTDVTATHSRRHHQSVTQN
jgi:hypothetical protein